MKVVTPHRALISVSDKTGIVEFTRQINQFGIEILSTGGTAQLLSATGIPVTEVSKYTGSPEMMGGRVKTLHPKVHGGILARLDVDQESIEEHGILPIDIVVVNLYPFEKVTSEPTVSLETAIENIDIGGPAMIRAAAKNHSRVTVVVDNKDYSSILDDLENYGGIRYETRFRLAARAYAKTAAYDSTIASYLLSHSDDSKFELPDIFQVSYDKFLDMRYGENPHQSAAFYTPRIGNKGWLANSTLHQGKPLSFNNVQDADGAYNCVAEFNKPACVIIKHATPCGVASATSIRQAYERAFQTDPTSAFGGVIALNRSLDADTASKILENQFVEVILAPGVDQDALPILNQKENVRLLEHEPHPTVQKPQWMLSTSGGGLLVQQSDTELLRDDSPKVVSNRAPTEDEMRDLIFAWKVAKHVKSNAIVYCKDSATIGLGAGQMSRVDSAKIASIKAADANLEVRGAVMASDAFFPFRDGIDTAANVGISAVIQPGGSMRDQQVIDAANEHGLAMLFTHMRHFRH